MGSHERFVWLGTLRKCLGTVRGLRGVLSSSWGTWESVSCRLNAMEPPFIPARWMPLWLLADPLYVQHH